jgi:membrane protease subunit (stomatin/prohibitin family)
MPHSMLPILHNTESYLSSTVICDLDGTISLLNGRDPHKQETCDNDKVNKPVAMVLELFYQSFENGFPFGRSGNGDVITFLSGREYKYRFQTRKFLNRAISFRNYNLFMRETGDFRKDSIIKKELFNKYIKNKYNVLFVMDDRNQIVDMWRNELKLTCFQVAEGNF